MSTSGAMKRRERRREHRGWRAGGGGRARRCAQSEAEAEVTGMPACGLVLSVCWTIGAVWERTHGPLYSSSVRLSQ
jgi:hypothetical protein